ncbi:MAG: ATP-dependent helicase [Candidatus Gastranaerophilales bacterium]
MNPSKEQQIFIDAEGKIVLCACPGSGKTFAIAHKIVKHIKNWEEPHKGIATLTFTNVAKDEIIQQVTNISDFSQRASYPHFIGTIDSFLNQFIFTRFAYLLTDQHKKPFLTHENVESTFRWNNTCHKKGCPSKINNFRWSLDGSTYENNKIVSCNEPRRCDEYKKMLYKKGVFFQNDVPYMCYKLLREHPTIANAIVERFPIILIDEAQDTSKEQMAIFDLLEKNGLKTIGIVGDPDQSIYEWRNANTSEFMAKISHENWQTLYFKENRRSSQMICNATAKFSDLCKDCGANSAVGEDKNFTQKPELMLIDAKADKEVTKEDAIKYFLQRCKALNITETYNNVAVLTRSRIHQNTDITGLWKSNEIKLLAQATYEWKYGSKKNAYNLCWDCLFLLLIDELHSVDQDIECTINTKISIDIWKDLCLGIVCSLPDADLTLCNWLKEIKNLFKDIDLPLPIRAGHTFSDVLKIKTKDKKNPTFQSISLKEYFEKKQKNNITISSIHGVKGETYEAVMLFAPSLTGTTITQKLISNGDLKNEHNRAAYVAMTRPKKYLAVAIAKPKDMNILNTRFPTTLWNYVELNKQ